MKKLAALALSMVTALAVIGCSKEEDTKWIDDSAKKIESEITSGQFVLDDVVYEFPMDLQYWLDNGWHISNNYDNVDEFTLEPGSSSSEFELFNEDGDYVTVSVLNTTSEDVKVYDCMVQSLELSLSKVDVVFPDGISKRSTQADIKKAYGEPSSVDDDSAVDTLSYNYETEEAWKCVVDVDVYEDDSRDYPCSDVKYYIMSFDTVWESLLEEKGTEEACRLYIDAAMNASFKNDFTDYVGFCIDSLKGAEALYQAEVEYYAEFLMYYLDINTDYIDDATKEKFVEISKKVLSKVMWEVVSVENENSLQAELNIKLYPTNFLDIIDADVTEVINQFYTKYEGTDFDAMSDEEYALVEEEYTTGMLEALEKNADLAGTKDAVEKTYDVSVDGVIISEEDWTEIDDIIMDTLE